MQLLEARGVGQWDIMGHPYGADNSGTPGLLGAWTKEVVGWVTPTQITANGDYTIQPAHTSTDVYSIDISQPGTPVDEYLLIENRQAFGFEANLGGSGLIIWHIDDAVDMKQKGMPGQEGWPDNGNHYQVAVLPKDGKYDLENNVNFGDPGDLWVEGDSLTPGNGNTVFPNTDSYQFGFIVETGITIDVLKQEDNGNIVFRISGLGGEVATADSPAETETETPAPTTAPAVTTPAPTPDTDTTSGAIDSTPPPAPGAPTPAPTLGDRWILSRPPGPTRAPFSFPEFPQQKPMEILEGEPKVDSSAMTTTTTRWDASMLLGITLPILHHFLA